jgi:hypothetical protein
VESQSGLAVVVFASTVMETSIWMHQRVVEEEAVSGLAEEVVDAQ